MDGRGSGDGRSLAAVREDLSAELQWVQASGEEVLEQFFSAGLADRDEVVKDGGGDESERCSEMGEEGVLREVDPKLISSQKNGAEGEVELRKRRLNNEELDQILKSDVCLDELERVLSGGTSLAPREESERVASEVGSSETVELLGTAVREEGEGWAACDNPPPSGAGGSAGLLDPGTYASLLKAALEDLESTRLKLDRSEQERKKLGAEIEERERRAETLERDILASQVEMAKLKHDVERLAEEKLSRLRRELEVKNRQVESLKLRLEFRDAQLSREEGREATRSDLERHVEEADVTGLTGVTGVTGVANMTGVTGVTNMTGVTKATGVGTLPSFRKRSFCDMLASTIGDRMKVRGGLVHGGLYDRLFKLTIEAQEGEVERLSERRLLFSFVCTLKSLVGELEEEEELCVEQLENAYEEEGESLESCFFLASLEFFERVSRSAPSEVLVQVGEVTLQLILLQVCRSERCGTQLSQGMEGGGESAAFFGHLWCFQVEIALCRTSTTRTILKLLNHLFWRRTSIEEASEGLARLVDQIKKEAIHGERSDISYCEEKFEFLKHLMTVLPRCVTPSDVSSLAVSMTDYLAELRAEKRGGCVARLHASRVVTMCIEYWFTRGECEKALDLVHAHALLLELAAAAKIEYLSYLEAGGHTSLCVVREVCVVMYDWLCVFKGSGPSLLEMRPRLEGVIEAIQELSRRAPARGTSLGGEGSAEKLALACVDRLLEAMRSERRQRD